MTSISHGYQIRDQNAIHFVTFAVVHCRACRQAGVDILTRDLYRNVLIESLQYCQQEKGLKIYAWVIMTNHVHFILSAKEGYSLSNILRDFKKFTSVKLLEAIQNNERESRKDWILNLFESAGKANMRNTCYQVWRQDNHPIELSSNQMVDQRLNYLHNNPVEAGFARNAEDYVYSSAFAYQNGFDNLLELDVLF